MINAAVADLRPAPEILISAAIAASELSGIVASAAARCSYISHAAYCMLLCRFMMGGLALHVYGIHSSSPFII